MWWSITDTWPWVYSNRKINRTIIARSSFGTIYILANFSKNVPQCWHTWEEELVVEIRNLLTNVTLQGTESDVWLWWHNISDGYTVRGVYQMLMRQEMHIHDAVTGAPWHKSAPLKVSICVWRLLRNRWPTKDN